MDDARPKMCFSPSQPPPTPEALFSSNLTFGDKCTRSSDHFIVHNTNYHCQEYNSDNSVTKEQDNMQQPEDPQNVNESKIDEETTSDYKQWLHAMKLVARLPGGIPPEFRRKLWLSLADKYLKSKNVNWTKEEEKCFCAKWQEDDEELGSQIVKDLHRTGSTLCTGPAGDLNQAKLKKILLGYARYNPEVGYCQGFNMLGALILQVMDKDESESMKVMIYLVEGILPAGYFCGSMGGLQADMAVFRELMQTKLPRLAKHLQKLQGPIENAYEPPLTNVFTMQWFLTMFCTCLPMSCVLRVWDLVLIEGSDVLLRTALVLWSLLEERVLSARSADDFYGKMGSFSSELLNGHLIDSNGLIEKVVQLGPIADLQKLRDKHLYNIVPIERQQGLQLFFDDDEPDIDEDSRLAVATVWGIPWGRRGSQGQANNNVAKQVIENKDRIALDISLLKKQYDRLRERQKQAQIILTSACSTASRQSAITAPLPVNQLLSGRAAIVTNKGRRSGPPTGAIPPARKPSLPAVLHDRPLEKQLRRGETLHWHDTKDTKNRRDSLSWKEIKAERAAMITSGSVDGLKSQKIRSGRLGKSDSSSYSEESDDQEAEQGERAEDASSTDTSLCDDDVKPKENDKNHRLHIENNHKSSSKTLHKTKKSTVKQRNQLENLKHSGEKARPKSWAPSSTEIPFVLMTTDSANNSADENPELTNHNTAERQKSFNQIESFKWEVKSFAPTPDDLVISKMVETPSNKFESTSTKEAIPFLDASISLDCSNEKGDNIKTFDISNEGVTNEYFERVNSTERPTKLDLLYSLNEDEHVGDVFNMDSNKLDKSNKEPQLYANDKDLTTSSNVRCMDLLVDYSEKSSAACIEEAKNEISTTFQSQDTSTPMLLKNEYPGFTNENFIKKTKRIAEKRRDPRRLTLTRSSTMDTEKRFQTRDKRFSIEVCSDYQSLSDEIELNVDTNKNSHQSYNMKFNKTNNVYSDPLKPSSSDKKIPSTADLEERFENIQQQLVRDRRKTIKSPSDSENAEKPQNLNTSSAKFSQNDKKINHSKKKYDNEDTEDVEGAKILNAHSDVEKKSSATVESGDINKTNSTKSTQISTIQTTQNTKSETKSLQNKKEPPDEKREDDAVEERDLRQTSRTKIETTANENAKDSEESVDDSNNIIRKSSCEGVEEKEIIEENRKGSERSSDRASPPSTEELEKRFCALEEQMASAKNESNEIQPNAQRTKQNTSKEPSEKSQEHETKATKFHNESFNQTRIDTSQTEADNFNNVVSGPLKTSLTKFERTGENSTKRRLSEPPSTEDLEKRYEVLKRRMSSRNFETRTPLKDGLATELQQTNKTIINTSSTTSSSKRSPPSTQNLEERFERLQKTNDSKNTTITPPPPSRENLKEHCENLQSKNDQTESKQSSNTASPTKKEDQVPNENNTNAGADKNNKIADRNSLDSSEGSDKTSDDKDQTSEKNNTNKTIPNSRKEVEDNSESTKSENVAVKEENNIKTKLLQELQAKLKEHYIITDVDNSVEKKMALMQELKTKINLLPDKYLKPTQISTRRHSPSQSTLLPSLSFNDETLESHAASAFRRSGKHEPTNSAKRKMVRRFSDLPSRADLENRLQFLEEQLSKTVCMQRRSSDSEVASKAHVKHKGALTNVPQSGSLERRVLELEKRLNDKRTFSMDVECPNGNETNLPDIGVSQVDHGRDTVSVTGQELVRYSSHGEVLDIEHQNPINISINIQMTLNKDDTGSKKNTDVSKTDDLDRRLQFLEQRLKTSQVHDAFEIATENGRGSVGEKDNNSILSMRENSGEKEDTDGNKGNSVQITQEISHEDTEAATESQSIPVTKLAGDIENRSSAGKQEQSEAGLLSDKTDNSCQSSKTNQPMETTKSVDSKASDKSQEDTNSQQHFALIEEDKQTENKIEEIQDKENNVVADQTKSAGTPSNTNTSMEPTQDSLKDDKNDANSPQQKTQTQDNLTSDPPKLMELNKHSETLPNKAAAEPELCEPVEKKIIDKYDNSESEIKKLIGSNGCSQVVPVEVNKKTLVLLLDNEPKAVKVRRLTRANTEELEDLFQALEKQLNDRGQQKSGETTTKTASAEISRNETETSTELLELAKEIKAFSQSESSKTEQNAKPTQAKPKKQEEEFDWGIDPIKYHLKKRTVYLPSTKELEARFRSLERQIKLLEDVEKIDVEQRLTEIERKIKLQYSLSHEKDLNKFLELCEGKDPDEISTLLESHQGRKERCSEVQLDQKCSPRHTSPHRLKEPIPSSSNPEYRYRSLDLKRSNSKQSFKKQPIHPLEMLLDPSPDECDIPTTGELEHRIRVMEENRYTPSPPSRKSRSQSPPTKQNKTKANPHILERNTTSSTERELPTAEELEARLEALEKEQSFNIKMQKNFQQFNQKLKDVVSPSLSFDELKSSTKPCHSEHTNAQACSAPKQKSTVNTIGPKTIRFCEEDHFLPKKETETLNTISGSKGSQQTLTVREDIGVMGIRLMRETSPLRRKGTHTGVPLRTGENINDQLTSIQNTIKSIDSLCEEKPYRKERCQQYIDALFSDSTHFARKKTSLEDLTAHNLSRSTSREMAPAIRISDHGSALSRSMGSADSIQSSSPLRSSSPLQYRSNRDLRREPSPRRRRDEDREEHESRVRRDNLLPNNTNYSHSILSPNSLTKFHKVDSQLISNEVEHEESFRHPTFSTRDSLIYHENANTSNNVNRTPQSIRDAEATTPGLLKSRHSDSPFLPLCHSIPPSSNTPIYTPAKLAIRHTTVTSTFYDRVLTEKQLEKQHHHSYSTNNQSPLISPLIERHVKPIYEQQTNKSPTNVLQTDTINTLNLTDASTGNYHHSYQPFIQNNNHC